MELGIKGHLMALNKCAKFESTDNTEILLTQHLTYLTLKVGNTKVKVKSYHGNQKNMLVATHRPIFKFVALSMSEILLQPETLTKMLTDRQTDGQ